MKLKTLKDLQKDCEWKYDTYKALRQEAIKWVKNFKDRRKSSSSTLQAFEYNAKIEWIKHFFNISEEVEK